MQPGVVERVANNFVKYLLRCATPTQCRDTISDGNLELRVATSEVFVFGAEDHLKASSPSSSASHNMLQGVNVVNRIFI